MTNLRISGDKTNVWLSQKQRVFQSLQSRPQTRWQVSLNASTPLQNVCRLVAGWRKDGAVYVVKIDRCPISNAWAEFISTDPKYTPAEQLRLFE